MPALDLGLGLPVIRFQGKIDALSPDIIRDTVLPPAWAAVAILKTGVAKGQKAIVAAIKGGLRKVLTS